MESLSCAIVTRLVACPSSELTVREDIPKSITPHLASAILCAYPAGTLNLPEAYGILYQIFTQCLGINSSPKVGLGTENELIYSYFTKEAPVWAQLCLL